METFNLVIDVGQINGIYPRTDKAITIDIDVRKYDADAILDALIRVMGKEDIHAYVEQY